MPDCGTRESSSALIDDTARLFESLVRRPVALTYSVAAAAILAPIGLYYDYSLWLNLKALGLSLAVGAVWLAAVSALARRYPARKALTLGTAGLVAAAFVFTVAYALTGFFEPKGYGDRLFTLDLVASRNVFERWFLGTAAWRLVFAGVWDTTPPFVAAKPYMEISGAFVMAAAGGALLWRWPGRLSIILPMLTPVWLLFAMGYIEYYPMIAWLFLLAVAYLMEPGKTIGERSPWVVGALAAVLPLAYIGYAVLSPILVGAYAVARPRRLPQVMAAAAVTGAVCLLALYPYSVTEFPERLDKHMRFDETMTWAPYRGQELYAWSNFFHPAYALSPTHIGHLLFLYVFGGSMIFPILLAIGAALAWRSGYAAGGSWRKLRSFLGVALLLWHVYYFFFYIPRLGPVEDVDLFFSTFLVVAYLAGYLFDRLIERGAMREEFALVATAAATGGTAVSLTYLAVVGLPPMY